MFEGVNTPEKLPTKLAEFMQLGIGVLDLSKMPELRKLHGLKRESLTSSNGLAKFNAVRWERNLTTGKHYFSVIDKRVINAGILTVVHAREPRSEMIEMQSFVVNDSIERWPSNIGFRRTYKLELPSDVAPAFIGALEASSARNELQGRQITASGAYATALASIYVPLK